jgi:hypothetical protein
MYINVSIDPLLQIIFVIKHDKIKIRLTCNLQTENESRNDPPNLKGGLLPKKQYTLYKHLTLKK